MNNLVSLNVTFIESYDLSRLCHFISNLLLCLCIVPRRPRYISHSHFRFSLYHISQIVLFPALLAIYYFMYPSSIGDRCNHSIRWFKLVWPCIVYIKCIIKSLYLPSLYTFCAQHHGSAQRLSELTAPISVINTEGKFRNICCDSS